MGAKFYAKRAFGQGNAGDQVVPATGAYPGPYASGQKLRVRRYIGHEIEHRICGIRNDCTSLNPAHLKLSATANGTPSFSRPLKDDTIVNEPTSANNQAA